MVPFIRAMKFLSVAVTFLGVSACSSGSDSPAPNPYQVDAEWNVNEVSVTCSDSNRCPEALGVLLTIDRSDYKIMVYRCTAALYEAAKVVTAGHCTRHHTGSAKSYFRTVATPGKPSRTFPVSRVLKQVFNEADTRATDYAAVELAVAATGYTFVKAPVGGWTSTLKELTAVVANQSAYSDGKVITMDAVDCEYNAGDKAYPPITRFPNIFPTKSCKLVKGNSGGPIFARNDLSTVLGVLSRSSEAKADESEGSDLFRNMFRTERPSTPAHLRNTATFSNANCFELPGWSKPAPQCIAMSEKVAMDSITENLLNQVYDKTVLRMRQWFVENPSVNVGQGKIKMAPLSVEATKSGFAVGRNEKELYSFFFPSPLCIEQGPIAAPLKLPFVSRGSKLMVTIADGADFTLSNLSISGNLDLRQNALGKWVAKYDWRALSWEYQMKSDLMRRMANGVELDLKPCVGDEEAKLYEDLRKELAAPIPNRAGLLMRLSSTNLNF